LARLRADLREFYARRLPDREDAEDFAQDTIARALERGSTERALLFTIANGLLVDEYRRRERQPEEVSWESLVGPEHEGLDHIPQFQTYDFEDADFTAVHDRAVRALEPLSRDAYIVGELRGLTSREAADVLSVSRTTANSRRAAATAEIRKELVS
jgi:RNA polymerase sigma factor (sigma-70 family)